MKSGTKLRYESAVKRLRENIDYIEENSEGYYRHITCRMVCELHNAAKEFLAAAEQAVKEVAE